MHSVSVSILRSCKTLRHYMMDSTSHAVRIFKSSVDAVRPDKLIAQHLVREGHKLHCGNRHHMLNNNVYVVGFGKAISGMCRAVQDIVGDHIVNGTISVPCGLLNDLSLAGKNYLLPVDNGKIKIYEGAVDNQPDETASLAAGEILKICENAKENDLVIALVSGGGSALLPSPIAPLTLCEKSETIKLLMAKGATIQEVNIVRQCISNVKGGRLALKTSPAKMWSFILSDIIDDPVELIASGPTVPCSTNASDAMKVINKYCVGDLVPRNVHIVLSNIENSNGSTDHAHSIIVGSNKIAISAAISEAKQLGYASIVLSDKLKGEARDLGILFCDLAIWMSQKGGVNNRTLCKRNIADSLILHGMDQSDVDSFFNDLARIISHDKPICILGGGETTVTLQGSDGLGGRNQEMVLASALRFSQCGNDAFKNRCFSFLSAGTDGQDGPTPAAGAMFSSHHVANFDTDIAKRYLSTHDSYSYFSELKTGSVITGLTGTNVMDVHVLLISPVLQ